jgi:hypothetical protein
MNRVLFVNYQLIDCGKTPAYVDSGGVMADVVKPSELPEEPDYSDIKNIPLLMAPGRPMPQRLPVVLRRDEISSLLNESDAALMVYGIVRYRDTLNESAHQSRFCALGRYLQNASGFVLKMGGPPAYNRYT